MTGREEGYAPGRARRELILEAAVAAFGTAGFESATLTDIANACGVSRQGLLHHFGSKEELLTAVLARRDELDGRRFTAAIANNRTPTQALAETISDNTRSPTVMRLYTVLSAEATNPSHAAHDYFSTLYARLRSQLADAIRDAQATGAFPPGQDPQVAATVLLALKDGLALQALLAPGQIDAAEIMRQADELLSWAPRDPGGSGEAAP